MSAANLIGLLILLCLLGVLLVVVAWAAAVILNVLAGLVWGRPLWGSRDAPRSVRVRPRIPAQLRRAVLARDGYACQQCGSTKDLEMDHVIALSKGGATTLENLEVLCHECNERKGNRP